MAKEAAKSIEDIDLDEKPKPQGVTIGRMVHYQPPIDDGAEPWAAIVTKVVPGTDTVGLCVFDPNGLTRFKKAETRFSAKPAPGCWSWPPRV